ncbi:hypothetical protein SCOR_12920 [Sulfidibacter corallicola]
MRSQEEGLERRFSLRSENLSKQKLLRSNPRFTFDLQVFYTARIINIPTKGSTVKFAVTCHKLQLKNIPTNESNPNDSISQANRLIRSHGLRSGLRVSNSLFREGTRHSATRRDVRFRERKCTPGHPAPLEECARNPRTRGLRTRRRVGPVQSPDRPWSRLLVVLGSNRGPSTYLLEHAFQPGQDCVDGGGVLLIGTDVGSLATEQLTERAVEVTGRELAVAAALDRHQFLVR